MFTNQNRNEKKPLELAHIVTEPIYSATKTVLVPDVSRKDSRQHAKMLLENVKSISWMSLQIPCNSKGISRQKSNQNTP